MTKKIILSWSGGKDSAITLHELKNDPEYEIETIFTTVTEGYDRISMHGVRRTLLEKQADALGLDLETLTISKKSSDEEYEIRMRAFLEKQIKEGITTVAFGDIFLEDLRKYREDKLRLVEMTAVFPLWGNNTEQLANSFVEDGFKAVITCVDTEKLDGSFSGRTLDRDFLNDLPDGIDPCGENGEFHSFVYDGPVFTKPVSFSIGQTVLRDDRFSFTDLIDQN